MTEWRECKLKELADFNPESLTTKNKLQFINYLDTGNITKGKIDTIQYLNLSTDKVPSRAKRIVKKNDIIYSTVRPNQEHYGIIKNPIDNMIVSTGFVVLRSKEDKCDSNFLYYFLTLPENTEYLSNVAEDSTTAYPSITPDVIMNMDIALPPLPEQKAIAEVLSSLDDKIDLLTRQNKTLEDLAQAYFRKWFIEDASSEWEVGKLGDEFNITMGQSPKGETYNDLKIGLPFFQGKAEFGFRFPLEKQYCSEPIKIADKFDTLLSVRAPVGALNMALYKCCIGRGLAIPIHKKGYKHYTFYKMKSLQELFNTFDDDGTVFGSISREKFLSIDNVIPPEKLVCYFDNFAKYFDLKIYENTVQIRTLSKLRDTLLPKLISGEVRVNI
ncbi:restriction endonuclease subunit S [Acetivibrio thermocellus]|jgi:type I restriction enzyme S subunit|uniref:restriction endonuclease subunit S n=1 Tax=Acetivibrio thermocellus TaxID=1515 RepID=UPI0021AD9836|nr:restriction endonuclease subunit S [Acetivibrio thermocellus]UWV46366.1 restriction endonuclease subunit S [Acetivibrio thermocellus]